MPRKRTLVLAASATVLAVLVTFGLLAAAVPGMSTLPAASASGLRPAAVTDASDAPSPVSTTTSQIKNVVLLLADDLDWAAFDQVPRLAALKAQGTTLSNFVVTDSLCCPSRSSILRGQYVHNHRVLSNVPQTGGGWEKFFERGLQRSCLPTWLHSSGVQTALVGKYLNGFPKGAPSIHYVPPGWDHFTTALAGNEVYGGYDYVLSKDGTIVRHTSGRFDFLNDVLTADATQWLDQTTGPFFLELASYSPHVPAPVATRNVGTHVGATAPRPPSFNARGVDEPSWLRKVPTMAAAQLPRLDRLWSRRLESAESIADSYDALVAQLAASGHSNDTMIVVTSDNGYHLGEHRLPTGKQTPYREDTIVPTIVIGPGIKAGATIDAMTSTVDLAPTIASVLGSSVPSWADGRNLMPLLADPVTTPWRSGVLVESLAKVTAGDPDYAGFDAPFFHELRTRDWVYVQYAGGEEALYDLVGDPYEINNIAATAPVSVIAPLRAQLSALEHCAGASCRVADSLPVPASLQPDGPGGPGSGTAAPAPTASPSG